MKNKRTKRAKKWAETNNWGGVITADETGKMGRAREQQG